VKIFNEFVEVVKLAFKEVRKPTMLMKLNTLIFLHTKIYICNLGSTSEKSEKIS
jgi:hypothetical protein